MACVGLANPARQPGFAKAGFREDRLFDDVPHGWQWLMVRERRQAQAA